jgi:hypothetical protein
VSRFPQAGSIRWKFPAFGIYLPGGLHSGLGMLQKCPLVLCAVLRVSGDYLNHQSVAQNIFALDRDLRSLASSEISLANEACSRFCRVIYQLNRSSHGFTVPPGKGSVCVGPRKLQHSIFASAVRLFVPVRFSSFSEYTL